MTTILLLYMIPILTGLLCLLPLNSRWPGRIQIIGMLFLLGTVLVIIQSLIQSGPQIALHYFVYLDAFSGLMLLLISLVGLLAGIYSYSYIQQNRDGNPPTIRKLKLYYGLINLFLLSMLVMVTTNNLGLFWIAIESSTLFTAFLVGYYNQKEPVEAAWKYIMLCATGIALAVIGITIGYFAVIRSGGIKEAGMNWNYLMAIAPHLDPAFIKIAFIFVLIGYGTKAGLAPLHNWLPDAYSEAPAPVSALLSGTLSKCALYGIIRYAMLTNRCVDGHFTHELLLFFGLLSLGIAVPFLLIQTNIKRLLAYSSVEHIGIIAIGLGIGSPLAVFGALFHMLNHALVKAMMFFTAGNIVLKFQSKKIKQIQGAIHCVPVSGTMLLIGGLALAGAPPFSVFLSEFYIIRAGIQQGLLLQTVLTVFLLVIAFTGLSYHFIQMTTGPEPISAVDSSVIPKGEISRFSLIALLIPFVLLFVLGVWQPQGLLVLLHNATQLILGGA